MTADHRENASYETRQDAISTGGGEVQMWLDAIEARSNDREEDWRKLALNVTEVYRSESLTKHESSGYDGPQSDFNILYANTETLLPAIYNSTPVPDIRRRFNDPGLAAKAVVDMLERSLQHSCDRYDFDKSVRDVSWDAAVPGRGVGRVRYFPPDGERKAPHVQHEYVSWKNFRRGPGICWEDVTWVAFLHYFSKTELKGLADDGVSVDDIPLNYDADGAPTQDKDKGLGPLGDIFKRAKVWEVWDKERKEVLFLATDYKDKPIARQKDPLKLEQFLPLPRPIVPIETPGDPTPVPLYESYRKLAEELNETCRRIGKLIKGMRAKGFYPSSTQDLENIAAADDLELVAVAGLDAWAATGGDIGKLIAWWPIEALAKAVLELREHRNALVENIYQVSGLSDLQRGQSEASETATAQNIKNQWGSLRVQRLQAEVQRYVRDVLRLKAEIIANHFDMEYLVTMTGVKLVKANDKAMAQQQLQAMQQQQQQMAMMAQQSGAEPPAPQPPPPELVEMLELPTYEEVEPMLRDDLTRSFKVDIESDSTIRADLTRNIQNMAQFMEGTGKLIQGAVPALETGVIPPELLLEVFAAWSRQFKLGKQVEDTIEKTGEKLREAAKQPKPPKPDPEMAKAQAEIALEEKKQAADERAKQRELDFKERELAAKLKFEREKLDAELQMEREKHEAKLQQDQQRTDAEVRMMEDRQTRELAMAEEAHGAGLERDLEAHTVGMTQKDEAHQKGLSQAEEAHRAKVSSEQEMLRMRSEDHEAKKKEAKAKGPRKFKLKSSKGIEYSGEIG